MISKTLTTIARFVLLLPYLVLNKLDSIFIGLYETIRPGMLSQILDQRYRNTQLLTRTINHKWSKGMVVLKLHVPNLLCEFRRRTFSSKEPETLEWIENFGGDGALFDIGANVGLYSLYYAKIHKGPVFAFEPSVFNLRLLAQNISVNQLDARIRIVPNPLTKEPGFADFGMSSVDEGGALSAFGVDFDHQGQKHQTSLRYSTLGLSLDDMFRFGLLTEIPSLIKIDVDGVEHLILEGSKTLLTNSKVRSVLIEVEPGFDKAFKEVSDILTTSGFKQKKDDRFKTSNQIWVRS